MNETRQMAEFVAELRYAAIPLTAVAAGKSAILDSVGVALAGSHEEAGHIVAALARDEGAKEESTVFGHGFRTSATAAALANGTATHALDFDASFTSMGQPMAGLTAAVLALAEPLGASGQQVIEAYLAGYEVTAKLVWSMPAGWGETAWHATATLGSLGCTAAAARLLDLDAEQTLMALGIATSMAGGVVANFGSMGKPLHAGMAARNGVLAARLAQRGFTGSDAGIESAVGLHAALAWGGAPDLAALGQLGTVWDVERGVRFKAYPCGGLSHTAIDAALALRAEYQLTADQIERIDARVTAYAASRIVYRIPKTELQAKFSMCYVLARAIIDGTLTPDTFSDEAIRDPATIALAERVFMEADLALDNGPRGGRPSHVTIHLKDGRTLERRVDFPTGSPESPFGPGKLHGKLEGCARRLLDAPATDRVMDLLEHLEEVPDIRELSALLAG